VLEHLPPRDKAGVSCFSHVHDHGDSILQRNRVIDCKSVLLEISEMDGRKELEITKRLTAERNDFCQGTGTRSFVCVRADRVVASRRFSMVVISGFDMKDFQTMPVR